MKSIMGRRTFLRGVLGAGGVAIGLPVLDAMLDRNGTALAGGEPLPKRFGVWFWGNGSDPDRWAPAEEGPGWTPSEMLQPLDMIKDYVTVVSGAHLPTSGRNNPHVEGAAGILAGGDPLIHESYGGESNDWDYMTVPGPSVDQVASQHIRGATPFSSLVLGITRVHTADAGSSNSPGTAQSYISHVAPYLFNPPRMDPSEVFRYLFSGAVHEADEPVAPDPMVLARASVLDAVLEDSRSLRARLGRSDRARLDNHLDSIRELEARLKGIPPMPGPACTTPQDPGFAESYRARASAMAELIAMAFACDLTRVFSFEFSSPASHVDYPDIFPDGLTFNGSSISFHEYEHQAGIDDTVRAGVTYFIEMYAELLQKLQGIQEGEGNLLDNCCILGTSELAYGHVHGFDNYPLLIGGSAGGALQYPAVHVAVDGDTASRVPFTCLRAVGADLTSWGEDDLYVDETLAAIET